MTEFSIAALGTLVGGVLLAILIWAWRRLVGWGVPKASERVAQHEEAQARRSSENKAMQRDAILAAIIGRLNERGQVRAVHRSHPRTGVTQVDYSDGSTNWFVPDHGTYTRLMRENPGKATSIHRRNPPKCLDQHTDGELADLLNALDA